MEWRGACVAVSEPEKRPATCQRDNHRSHPCPHLVTVIVRPTRLPPRTRILRRARAWESTKAVASVHMGERTDARARCNANTHAPTRMGMGTRARNTNRGEPHAGQRRRDRATLPRHAGSVSVGWQRAGVAVLRVAVLRGSAPLWLTAAAGSSERGQSAHVGSDLAASSARCTPHARTHATHTHQALPAPMGAAEDRFAIRPDYAVSC